MLPTRIAYQLLYGNQGNRTALSAVPYKLNLVRAVCLNNDISAVERNTEVNVPSCALANLELLTGLQVERLGGVSTIGAFRHGEVGIPRGTADATDNAPCVLLFIGHAQNACDSCIVCIQCCLEISIALCVLSVSAENLRDIPPCTVDLALRLTVLTLQGKRCQGYIIVKNHT